MSRKPTAQLELLYIPYLSLGGLDELKFGSAVVWNADRRLNQHVPNPRLRKRVDSLLAMNTIIVRGPKRVRVKNIGVVSIGTPDFHVLSNGQLREARQLRAVLFLCCLSKSASLTSGNENAGLYQFTSENFGLVRQNFRLTGNSLSETAGVIAPMRHFGYRISSTRFPKPTNVPQPLTFQYDSVLLRQLVWLRRHHRALYSRIIRATDVFIESYYNSENVPMASRILLQTLALETLLDLPETNQRKHLKDEIERYCNESTEKRFRYSYEVHDARHFEVRTVKALWADRFYTLRNHIIHGASVRAAEYTFRDKQNHFLIASKFFVLIAKRLIDERRMAEGLKIVFEDRIDWMSSGFELSPSEFAMLVKKASLRHRERGDS